MKEREQEDERNIRKDVQVICRLLGVAGNLTGPD